MALSVVFSLALSPSAGRASNFQELSDRYFIDRSVEYARELLLKEEYLRVLYQCTAEESRARQREGLRSSLLDSPFGEIEPAYFDRDDPALAFSTIADRYRLWVDYEEREYQRRLQTILDIRQSLITSADPAQKQRMFRRELEQALIYYGRSDWEITSLIFDRLLKDYNYQAVDDILFYQSEACIQLKQYDAALICLSRLLDQYPDSPFRAQCYDRASEILISLGEHRDLIRLYETYLSEGAPGKPADMGGMHLRAAQAEVFLGHYPEAVAVLERVDHKSPNYLASRYYLADCLADLEEWSRAADVLADVVNMKRGNLPYDRWRLFRDEARIKLAFIYYEREEYDKAAELFKSIKYNSPFYDRVLMGKAWIAYQLDRYDRAIVRSEELLRLYPLSAEIYEASSLAGYCYEQLGEESAAMSYFYEVLEAGVGRNNLQTYLQERRRIQGALSELRALEENVFASGDERIFAEYQQARNLLELDLKRIGLAELLEVNAQMRSLVEERVLLDRLLREKAALEPEVIASDDASTIADFLALEDRIFTIMDHLNALGKNRLKATPLYYRETRVAYANEVADTLSARLKAETGHLSASIAQVEKLHQEKQEDGRLVDCFKLGVRLDRLNKAIDQGYSNRALAEASHRPVLRTRVGRWSDYSFNRYAMGGIEVDELERMYDRLQQVENYILALDEMIEQLGPGADAQSTGESLPKEDSGQSQNQAEETSEEEP